MTSNAQIKRAAAVQELREVTAVLVGDMKHAQHLTVTGAGGAGGRRIVVRAFFAMVEGLMSQMRHVALASYDDHLHRLTAGELAVLREQKFGLDDKGEPKGTGKHPSILQGMQFTLSMQAKTHGIKFAADKSVPGWGALKRAVKVRDRVTHPKSLADLEVTDADAVDLVTANSWWQTTLVALLDACDEADKRYRSSAT